jgi:hypothetical protein
MMEFREEGRILRKRRQREGEVYSFSEVENGKGK